MLSILTYLSICIVYLKNDFTVKKPKPTAFFLLIDMCVVVILSLSLCVIIRNYDCVWLCRNVRAVCFNFRSIHRTQSFGFKSEMCDVTRVRHKIYVLDFFFLNLILMKTKKHRISIYFTGIHMCLDRWLVNTTAADANTVVCYHLFFRVNTFRCFPLRAFVRLTRIFDHNVLVMLVLLFVYGTGVELFHFFFSGFL